MPFTNNRYKAKWKELFQFINERNGLPSTQGISKTSQITTQVKTKNITSRGKVVLAVKTNQFLGQCYKLGNNCFKSIKRDLLRVLTIIA